MNAKRLIGILAKESIFISLEGVDLTVKHPGTLADEDINLIKEHKPELIEHLRLVPANLTDIYGRRQCKSCHHHKFNRCNSPAYNYHDAWGNLRHYTPDSAQWWRCEFHSYTR